MWWWKKKLCLNLYLISRLISSKFYMKILMWNLNNVKKHKVSHEFLFISFYIKFFCNSIGWSYTVCYRFMHLIECENLGCNFIAWINYYVVSMGLLLNVIMQYTYFLKTNWGFLVCFYFLRHIMFFQFICISSLDGIGQISIVLLQEGVCQLQCY